MGQITFSHVAAVMLCGGGLALFAAVRDYCSRDKLPDFRARMITRLAMAIAQIATASLYFMDLIEEGWASVLCFVIYGGFGLRIVIIECVSRYANAPPWKKLFFASAIGIAIIWASALLFLSIRDAYRY